MDEEGTVTLPIAGGKWQNNLPAQQWIYEDDKPTDREEYFLPSEENAETSSLS